MCVIYGRNIMQTEEVEKLFDFQIGLKSILINNTSFSERQFWQCFLKGHQKQRYVSLGLIFKNLPFTLQCIH